MECSQIQENLSAYLDGELDPGEEAELKSHLEGCETCRSELESLRSTVKLVRSVPRVPAPTVLKQRLTSAISARKPLQQYQSILGLIGAAAILLVTVVAVFLVTGPRTPSSEPIAAKTETAGLVEKKAIEAPAAEKAADRYSGEEAQELDEPLVAQAEGLKGKGDFPVEGGRGYLAEELKKDTGAPADMKATEARRKLAKSEELLEKAQRLPEADGKHLDELARRPESPRAQPDLREGGEGPAGGRGEASPAMPPPEPGKTQDALAQAKKPAGEALADEEKAPEEKRLEAPGESSKRIEQLVVETPDVKGTARLVDELLSGYRRGKPEQAEDENKPTGKPLELEKVDDDSAVYLVEVSTAEYQKLVEKLKALQGKAAPQGEATPKAKSRETDEEEKDAGPKWGGGAGRPPQETEPEARRGAARKGASTPGFSEEEENMKKVAPEAERQKEYGEKKSAEKPAEEAQTGADKERARDKAEQEEPPSETITVVIRVVRSDIARARLLQPGRGTMEDAAKREASEGK